MRITALAAAWLAAILCACMPACTQAATAVTASRLAILARGINADNAVLSSRQATYSAADIHRLRQMGFTYARFPVEASDVLDELPTPTGGISDAARAALGLSRLDAAIAAFTADGLAVMPTVFASPAIYARPDAQDVITRAAVLIASRYSARYLPHQLFIDVLNEPQFDPATWNAFAPQLVAAVRLAAPKHTLVVEFAGHALAANAAALDPLTDLNVVYAMHVYQPGKLTQQGAGGGTWPAYRFPRTVLADGTVVDRTEWTEAKMDAYFRVGPDWATAHDVPLIMNEFGTTKVADHDSWTGWVKFVRSEAELYKIGWAWWAFDGRLFGLDPHETGWDGDLVKLLSK